MLYTVSGVQILATLDAFGELDERVEDGRLKIGKCAYGQNSPSLSMLTARSHCKSPRP
jgi:hypothetical protein